MLFHPSYILQTHIRYLLHRQLHLLPTARSPVITKRIAIVLIWRHLVKLIFHPYFVGIQLRNSRKHSAQQLTRQIQHRKPHRKPLFFLFSTINLLRAQVIQTAVVEHRYRKLNHRTSQNFIRKKSHRQLHQPARYHPIGKISCKRSNAFVISMIVHRVQQQSHLLLKVRIIWMAINHAII